MGGDPPSPFSFRVFELFSFPCYSFLFLFFFFGVRSSSLPRGVVVVKKCVERKREAEGTANGSIFGLKSTPKSKFYEKEATPNLKYLQPFHSYRLFFIFAREKDNLVLKLQVIYDTAAYLIFTF